MTFMLIALLAAITAATGIVLADSGLRMWSAVTAIKARQVQTGRDTVLPALRGQRAARVSPQVSAQISFGRSLAPRRVAA